MKADSFYRNAFGRFWIKTFSKCGVFKLVAWYLHTKASKGMISKFIKNNGVDMKPFEGQSYNSFAEFFERKMSKFDFVKDKKALISPCDGLFSMYPIEDDMLIPLKGSHYRLIDIIPDESISKLFKDGLVLIFRLEASDYHHFCCIDEMNIGEIKYVPGLLHSVQPIACESVPVYKLNRRWWNLANTRSWGTIAQVEIGAMAVGGVKIVDKKTFKKGEEFGCFQLAGSTILILLDKENRSKLEFSNKYKKTINGAKEVKVKIGAEIAKQKK